MSGFITSNWIFSSKTTQNSISRYNFIWDISDWIKMNSVELLSVAVVREYLSRKVWFLNVLQNVWIN